MLHRFSRSEILIGREGQEILDKARVAVFGIGGVGSFTAEALARAGVGGLVLIDHDTLCITNINRQIHATTSTMGRSKVEVMCERVVDINPDAKVKGIKGFYCSRTSKDLLSTDYDYVVDAIDTVSSKLDLIIKCSSRNISIISSMGAGNKLDPTLFQVADIYETVTCPLARVIRRELRKRGIGALKVVYSPERPLKQKHAEHYMDAGYGAGSETDGTGERVTGSVSFVPSVAGLIIAGEVVKDLLSMGKINR